MTTNSLHTYYFTLRPMGSFFFGGERTFGQNNQANYFVRSNRFPQQTAILGMLRYELLRRHEPPLLSRRGGSAPSAFNNDNQTKMTNVELIGEASFTVGEPKQSFGQINRISPVFMRFSDQLFAAAPKNQSIDGHKLIYTSQPQTAGKSFRICVAINSTGNTMGIRTSPAPQLPGYDPKTYTAADLENIHNPDDLRAWSAAFEEASQIGITKRSGRGQRNDRGFYRRQSYRLNPGWAFSFWASFTHPITWKSDLVFLGAERSMFQMDVLEADWIRDYEEPFGIVTATSATLPTQSAQVILRSDARVADTIYDYCEFGITSVIDFRNIATQTQQSSFFGEPKKSKFKLSLLERGSVLYPKPGELKNLIDVLTDEAFQQIGYNAFTVTPTTPN